MSYVPRHWTRLAPADGGGAASRANVAEGMPWSETSSRGLVAPSRHALLVRRALRVSDVFALVLGLVALGLASRRPAPLQAFLWGLPSLPLWLLVFGAYGLYRRDGNRLGHTTVDDIPWLFHAMLLGAPLLWFYYRWLPGDSHFGKVALFAAVAGPSAVLLRAVCRSLSARLIAPERLLLVGEQEAMDIVQSKLRGHPGYGVEPVLRVEASALDASQLPQLVAQHGIDRVVVSHEDIDTTALLELLRRCRELSIKASVVPNVTDAMGAAVEIDDVAGMTLIALNPPVLSTSSRAAKRAMDLIGASLMLVATAPLLAIIALAIKLDSPGPVFFRQQRVGYRGRLFWVLKFRTMVVDAEKARAALLAQSKDPSWLDLEHDPRITRVGRLLRHTSLDEVPQLWNVLRGQMSLVGPRPLIPSEDVGVIGWARMRLDLMPGLSGLWQILGRTRIPFEEMIKLDYLYVTNWSLWGDVRLLLRTIPAVVMRRGAN
jgi:exopolysaccharide biosynthesis polyprenyl glycosylphosphotransferase